MNGAYYNNQNKTFNGTPTLMRVDPVINFNWNTVSPSPGIALTNYTVRWTGSVQPRFTETYTFSVTADDGVRLWVNGQELVNAWVTQPPTTYTGSIALKAQQLYDIQIDYFQATGGAVAELQWSSPFHAFGGRAPDPVVSVYKSAAGGRPDQSDQQFLIHGAGQRHARCHGDGAVQQH